MILWSALLKTMTLRKSFPFPCQLWSYNRAMPSGRRLEKFQKERNIPFCPSQEKFHSVVLKGLRKISDTFKKDPPMKISPLKGILCLFFAS